MPNDEDISDLFVPRQEGWHEDMSPPRILKVWAWSITLIVVTFAIVVLLS